MIHIFKSIETLTASLSDKVIHLARESSKAGIPLNIALSGGSTPSVLFEKIASTAKDPGLWDHVNFYWVDERCVPPGHLESNYRMTDETLFRPLSLSYTNVHRIMGEEESHAEADRYEELLRTQLPMRDGLPSFDLVLLGMGADGHTASIFPDQMPLMHSRKICEVAIHPETGQNRITLTGPVINNATWVCFMITGSRKTSILATIFEEGKEAEKYPAAHIKPAGGKLEWYLDAEAAQLLKASG